MKTCLKHFWTLLLALSLLAACGEEGMMNELETARELSSEQEASMKIDWDDVDPDDAGSDPIFEFSIADATETARLFDGGVARLASPVPFKQLGWMMDATDVSKLQYRAQKPDGKWTDWEDVFVYFSEGIIHNAHILLDFATTQVELRGGESILSALFEFREEVIARREILTADNGGKSPLEHDLDLDLRSTQQAVAPTSLVIPRSSWGAINPSKVCGSVVKPYRMTIHHTYRPSGDGGDAAARMRSMQSYHINTNKWCDIGYHFVVAQSGRIYQGRSRSDRPGAHTGNQNSGNVGISFIADFTTQTPTNTQLDAGAKIVKWVHDKHGVPLTRTAVKGHREWPGQSTTCPGANMINRISTILTRAQNLGGTTPPPPPPPEPEPTINYDVRIAVNIIGLENFYKDGSSEGHDDALPGDRFKAEIIVTNNSNGPIRGVQLGYRVYTPYLQATHYVIQTDHPEKDKRSWKTNDADSAPGNPAKDSLDRNGVLTMYAFGAGESKRVLIDLEAAEYSIGFVNHPNVRAWVKNIDDVYVQNAYGDDPTVNEVNRRLRAMSRVDVLSRQEWLFKGPNEADLEGWTGAGTQHYETLKLNTREDLGGMLAMKVTGDDARVVSPSWTRVEADQYDELVLEVRSHDGPHVKAVYWNREGESFSEDRVVRFEAEGDSEIHKMVIPMAQHPQWSGQIHRLRIDLIDDRAPVANGWQDLGMVYFQDSVTKQTTSYTEEYVEVAPVVLIGADLGEPPAFEEDEVAEKRGRPSDPAVEDPTELGDMASPSLGPDGSMLVSTNGGCSTAGVPGGPAPLGLLIFVGLGWIVVRRR